MAEPSLGCSHTWLVSPHHMPSSEVPSTEWRAAGMECVNGSRLPIQKHICVLLNQSVSSLALENVTSNSSVVWSLRHQWASARVSRWGNCNPILHTILKFFAVSLEQHTQTQAIQYGAPCNQVLSRSARNPRSAETTACRGV